MPEKEGVSATTRCCSLRGGSWRLFCCIREEEAERRQKGDREFPAQPRIVLDHSVSIASAERAQQTCFQRFRLRPIWGLFPLPLTDGHEKQPAYRRQKRAAASSARAAARRHFLHGCVSLCRIRFYPFMLSAAISS